MSQVEKTRQIIDIQPINQVELPDNPKGRFNALFAALGNSETKCVSLGCLTEYPQTVTSSHARFMEAIQGVWQANLSVPTNYYRNTLSPIGLVAEVNALYYGAIEYVIGYQITKGGLEYGQPIAYFLLQKSLTLPHSLRTIFGSTAAGPKGNRSVLTKAAILTYLYEKGSTKSNRDQISQSLGFDNSNAVSRSLKHLRDLGYIEYASVNTHDDRYFVEYARTEKFNPEIAEGISKYTILAKKVASLIQSLNRFSAYGLAEILQPQYPNFTLENLKEALAKVLGDFARGELCQSVSFTQDWMSEGQLTDLGKYLEDQILQPIIEAAGGDKALLERWRKIPWISYVPEAVVRYKEASGHINFKPRTIWIEKAFDIIGQYPGIRMRDLSPRLGRKGCQDLLKILLDQGRIRKEKKGIIARYYLGDSKLFIGKSW